MPAFWACRACMRRVILSHSLRAQLRLESSIMVGMTGKKRIVNTVVRDCLYLNWALPLAELPQPPSPLRYEVHEVDREELVFVSALLFRHESLHFEGLPELRVSYPQFHLRLHVIDHDEMSAVWLRHILVPAWFVPGIRLFGRQPAEAGRFRFPRPSRELDREQWRWVVSRGSSFAVTAHQASPRLGPGPRLGTWQQMVDSVRLRERAYVTTQGGIRCISTRQRSVPLWPVDASIESYELLEASKALAGVERWPELHSSWLCPEIPFSFELGRETSGVELRRSAVPVAPDPAMFRSPSPWARKTAA